MLNGFLVGFGAEVRGWPRQEHGVWFHGYLSDAVSLRRTLSLDAATSFGDIAAAAWQRWGAAANERLAGEYAAVITTDGGAVIIGDRLALRPVYHTSGPDGAVVSTDLAALVRETTAWRDLDEEYIADVLSSGMHLGTRTPYRDVKRLGVGEFATWTAGRMQVQGGWRPPGEPVAGTFDEHRELLRETVERAVAGALPVDGTPAAELSGGLDSSTVLAVAAGLTAMHALSFTHPRYPGSDETPWITAALATTPAEWHPIDGSDCGTFSAGPEFGAFLPAPARRILNWAPNAAQDDVAAALGATAILTGEGGDAVFLAGPQPWYLADLLRTGRMRQLRQEALRWSEHAEPRWSSAFWIRRAAVDGLRRWRTGRTLALEPTPPLATSAPWLHPDYVAARALQDRTQRTTDVRASSVHGQAVLENVLRCAEFARARHAVPSGGVEPRHPLLAPAVVDLALATPWTVAVDPRIDRAVQRYAFSGLVSDTVLRRRSKAVADEAVLHGFERNPAWREFLCADPLVVERGYVDEPAWHTALRAVGRVGGVTPLYSAIQVEVWLRHLRHVAAPMLLS